MLPTVPVAAVAWHNFTLWDTPDGPYALAEQLFGQQETNDPVDLERAEALWERLWAAAVHVDEAMDLIRNAGQNAPRSMR